MSLALDYSSDDAETVAKDAFGIISLSSSKKPRVDDSVESNTVAIDSAPHVLAEVGGTPAHQIVQPLKDILGSFENDISCDEAN